MSAVHPLFFQRTITPSAASLTFTVFDAQKFAVGDEVYISNVTTGGSEGFQGNIDSINGNNITIESDYVASSGAVFPAGSTVHKMLEITYEVDGVAPGITRTIGTYISQLDPNATFTAEYLDGNGNSASNATFRK